MADGGGQGAVLTTLNPAGMDIENWQALGINPDFAANQLRVIEAFARMGVITTCTCTPYLVRQPAAASASILPGRKAAPSVTPTRCWGRAATAKAAPAPWRRR